MTNLRLFQTERVYRRQFWVWWKWQKVLQTGKKHCGKRRNCFLRAISPFSAVFSKDISKPGLVWERVKTKGLLVWISSLTHYCHMIYNSHCNSWFQRGILGKGPLPNHKVWSTLILVKNWWGCVVLLNHCHTSVFGLPSVYECQPFWEKKFPVLEEELSSWKVLFIQNSSTFFFRSDNFRIFSSKLLESQDPFNCPINKKSAKNWKSPMCLNITKMMIKMEINIYHEFKFYHSILSPRYLLANQFVCY